MNRHVEYDCFGLPRGGAIFGLLIGIIMVLVGLQQMFGWHIDLWSYVIIIVGILFVAGSLYRITRR